MRRLGYGLGLVVCLVACGGDDDGASGGACLASLSLPDTCTPAFNPDWPSIYSNVLATSCGATGAGSTCHGRGAEQGGLALYDMNLAYDDLLGVGDHARVEPGDPKCSLLMELLESSDPSKRMPLGARTPLNDGYRCAIQQWIAAGASAQ